MASVTVPRGVLVALLAALLACLGVAAFLAGRASVPARPAAMTPAAAPEGAAPAATLGLPLQETLPPQPAAFPLPPAIELASQAQQPPAVGVTPPPGEPGAPPAIRVGEGGGGGSGVVPSLAPPPPGDAARVARYFQEMETAQAAAKYWSDPQALAGSLVEGLSKGDRTGIDQLITATRGALDRMRRISAPFDCSEHHRRSVDLVGQGIGLLESVAVSATENDPAALATFAARAQQLEADARAVDLLASRIKQRYGIS